MACTRACLLAGLLEAASVFGSIRTAPQRPLLRVRVYNLARVQPQALRGAQQVASRILERAGIGSAWIAGSAAAEENHLVDQGVAKGGACDDPLLSSELRLRLVAAAPPGFAPAALGFALPCARYGVQVTVFVDRVEQALARVASSYPTVLGHVLAHEVGHVLLRSEQHSSTGLMRAVWGQGDWQLMATSGLWLTGDEAGIMRQELRRIELAQSSVW